MKKFIVMGFPVGHSLSPLIHQAFAQQFFIPIKYNRLEVQALQLAEQIAIFKRGGGVGINLTAPLKQQALALVDTVTPRAKIAAAVNTIFFAQEMIVGDNTDGVGFWRDLTLRNRFTTHQKRILILGAGGAARGIIEPILGSEPELITIVNRDVHKAKLLISDFESQISSKKSSIQAVTYAELTAQTLNYDLIVNATSAWKEQEIALKNCNLNLQDTFVYDLNYGAQASSFLDYARQNGAKKVQNGIGMLVEQAAEAFYLWHGVFPDVDLVLETIHLMADQNLVKNEL